ncbi:MAG: phage tail assembly chaperone [Pikeienuella sp.]
MNPTGGASEPTDWASLMRLGLGALRLSPDSFWTMTPIELIRALEGAGLLAFGGGAMTRDRLERLMTAHPDRPPRRQTDPGPPKEG